MNNFYAKSMPFYLLLQHVDIIIIFVYALGYSLKKCFKNTTNYNKLMNFRYGLSHEIRLHTLLLGAA